MAILEGGSFLYLNVSKGKLINKEKGISTFGYEGILIGIRQKQDEYEGKEISKVELKMKDPKSDEIVLITFSQESWYCAGFFAKITHIDFTRPFIVGVSGSDQNEKVSFCWLKQGAETVKTEKGSFAAPTKTSRGKDNYDALLEASDIVIKSIQEKLGSQAPQPTSYNKPANQMPPNPKAKDDKIYENATQGESWLESPPHNLDDLPY